MNHQGLNLPGRLAQSCIESRLSPLLILALLLLGLVGLSFTPREENPQILVPAIEVRLDLPGATPEEVEYLLLGPLEAHLSALAGVKHSYGTALPGMAVVLIEFEVGEDEKAALVAVAERMASFERPAGSGEPWLQAVDVDDVPVFTLALVSAELDDYELRRVAERVLERLRSLPGVSLGQIIGGRPREIRLETTPERLQAFGISLDGLASAVAAADTATPLSERVYAGENRRLRLESRLREADEVAGIPLLAGKGQMLRLGEVAEVKEGPNPERTFYTRFGFGPGDPRFADWEGRDLALVTLAIAKREGVNAVELTQRLRQRVKQMAVDFLPPAVMPVVTRDDGRKADAAVSGLVEHLGLAVLAVSLILWIFLGGWAALIIACVIPLVFALVLGADLIAGPSLNRITLYALILALGMLVDDAIVVIENSHRHFQELPAHAPAAAKALAAVQATHEIGHPTSLATFTIVIVFLSLTLVTGMLGDYFYPIAFNLPVAMMASLLIAYSLTPWMARRWLPTSREPDPGGEWLARTYRAALLPLFRRPWYRRGCYLLVTLLLLGSLLQPAWQFIRPQGVAGAVSPWGVPLAFLPKDDKNSFLVHIHLPEPTPLEITDRAAREIESLLRRHPQVLDFSTHVGIPSVVDFNGLLKGSRAHLGPQYAEIRVNLVDKTARAQTSIELVSTLRPAVAEIAGHYPGGLIQLVEDPPGPPVRATLLAELYGTETKVLDRAARQVAEFFRRTHDMAEVWASVPFDVLEYRLRVRSDQAALAGVNPARVRTALRRLLGGEILVYAHPAGERSPVPVRLHIPNERRVDPATLNRAYVENDQGQRIPLSELVELVETPADRPINHKNGERVQYVGGELATSAPVYAILDLDRRLDGSNLGEQGPWSTANLRFQPVRPDVLGGYQLLWEGEIRLTLDAFRDMGLALGLAILGIFLLLVGYYQSFRLAGLALVSVPLGLIGVFPAHWLLDTTFSAASMVGVIALAGVVVRNSLMIIDFADENRRRGLDLEQAAGEAGAVRLRPILLTTLAIVLGTGIMIPDPVFGGIAIALIAGAISSAVLTLLLVPLLYLRLHRDSWANPCSESATPRQP